MLVMRINSNAPSRLTVYSKLLSRDDFGLCTNLAIYPICPGQAVVLIHVVTYTTFPLDVRPSKMYLLFVIHQIHVNDIVMSNNN